MQKGPASPPGLSYCCALNGWTKSIPPMPSMPPPPGGMPSALARKGLLRGFGDLVLQVAGLMITAELAQRCLVQLK
jgi:hypothetical protein